MKATLIYLTLTLGALIYGLHAVASASHSLQAKITAQRGSK